MASSVEFEPAPAITGTRPADASTHSSTTRLCSAWDRVGDSPVVPHGTRPWLPSLICQSTKDWKDFSSTAPPEKGVMSAVMEPLNMIASLQGNEEGVEHSPARRPRQGFEGVGLTGSLQLPVQSARQ